MQKTMTKDRVARAVRNISSSHVWRPRDMVNWHRLVQPLRSINQTEIDLDLFGLVYDLCTSLSIDYEAYTPLVFRADLPLPSVPPLGRGTTTDQPRIGLFVDAPNHISGVATTLTNWTNAAIQRGFGMQVLHAGGKTGSPNSVCFQPVGTLQLDAYDGLSLHVPKVRQAMKYAAQQDFDVIHISTPGPMGLLGLLVARTFNIPVVGTYHTDFPRYAVELTGDPSLEETTWNYMRWFYGNMELLAAPSEATRRDLVAHGFEADRIEVVGRGVDASLFTPRKRDASLREAWGRRCAHTLMYVGRVSEEKNLAVLTRAYKRLAAERADTCLVVVGDGPYLETMREELAGLPVVFTGFQKGEALARIYASADLFVFPSQTDTLGVVLLEAQSSGLPVIVSNQGGPQYVVDHDRSGLVLPDMAPAPLCEAIHGVLDEPGRLGRMKQAALAHAARFTLDESFNRFWDLHRRCWRPNRARQEQARRMVLES